MSDAMNLGILADQLPEGIYFRSKQVPAAFYRLLLINVIPGATSDDVKQAILAVWKLLGELAEGKVRDLSALGASDPSVTVPLGELKYVLAFGRRLFDENIHKPALVAPKSRPRELSQLRIGLPDLPFKMLHWKEPNEPRNDISHPLSNQADLALQLTGNTELTVNRAIVEIQKLITDSELPLRIATFFSGFKREDRRSWIDFHDGINTMSSEERQMAIEVTEPDQSWIVGGTFMCFLRIQVDLESWRKLSRQQQELIVGRDKLSGCPISQINRSPNNELEVKLISKCPFSGAIPLDAPPEYIDPPKATDPLLVASHIHRANFNRDSAQQPANNRIYRQGYEFLSPSPDGSLSLGLNFVSFQRDLKFVKTILELPSWMGGVNFGGPANPNPGEPTPIRLMSLIAGGFYAVPPIADPFPGASIFQIG